MSKSEPIHKIQNKGLAFNSLILSKKIYNAYNAQAVRQ